MALLKILSGDSAGASFAVGNGEHRVGRAEGNHIRLPDGSVSSSHCEITLDNSVNLLVRYLNSTNGTFIEGQRVLEAVVLPGQRLRLGNLELVYENSLATHSHDPALPLPINLPPPPVAHTPAPVRASSPPPVPAQPVANGCVNHPSVAAIAECKKCGIKACAECTKKQKVGRKIMHFCPSCGKACTDLREVAKQEAIDATRTKTFGTAIKRSLVYPFRGNGIIILGCGTLFFGVLDLFPFGFFALVIFVIVWGYMFAFMQRIVVTSAAGEDDPPEFPEVSDIVSDILMPFCQLVITLLVSCGVPIFIWVKMGSLPGQFAMLLSMIYFPMALLGVAMSDSFTALNPVFVLSSVMKVFKQYLVTCFVFAGLIFFYGYVQNAVAESDIPFIPLYFLFWFVFLVFLMIGMRILGMLYYLNRQKLGWGL
jgi:pSer/pThr/pTyr-binding forkhead associated (FHA) protein